MAHQKKIILVVTTTLLLIGCFCSISFLRKSSHQRVSFESSLPAGDAVSISFELPHGWKTQYRDTYSSQNYLPLGLSGMDSVYPIYDIYDEDNRLIGSIGCSRYEPFDGDSDSVAVVYSSLRLGSVYRFDTVEHYNIIQNRNNGDTAITSVVFQNGADSEPITNWGILSYNRDDLCFIALEIDCSIHESTIKNIASSICFQ